MIYERKGHCLEVSDRFIYLEEIYLRFPNRYELYSSKKYFTTKFLKNQHSTKKLENINGVVIRDWELEAAPKQYLLENGYKPV